MNTLAHEGHVRAVDFIDGLAYPWITAVCLLCLTGLGLLAGQQRARGIRAALLGLVIGWGLGDLLARAVHPPDVILPAVAGAMMILGLLVVIAPGRSSRRRAWLTWLPCASCIIVGAVSAWLATASAGLAPGHWIWLGGVMISAVATFLGVSVLTGRMWRRAGWPQVAVRVAGSWIAAIGMLLAALQW